LLARPLDEGQTGGQIAFRPLVGSLGHLMLMCHFRAGFSDFFYKLSPQCQELLSAVIIRATGLLEGGDETFVT